VLSHLLLVQVHSQSQMCASVGRRIKSPLRQTIVPGRDRVLSAQLVNQLGA
jgi:hypothetical protein